MTPEICFPTSSRKLSHMYATYTHTNTHIVFLKKKHMYIQGKYMKGIGGKNRKGEMIT